MHRRKRTAIEYIEEQALFVPFVLGDLMEHYGDALQKWTFAVEAARKGDLDRAGTYLVEAEIAIDIPMRVSRQELKLVIGKAARLVFAELPDDEDDGEFPMLDDRRSQFYERDGLGTEIYDAWAEIQLAGSPVEGDAEFYIDQARRWGSPVLDLGCGTGRIGFALAEQGFDVVGLDLSAPMLRIAERKRALLPAEVARRLTFVQGDIAEFKLDQTFPLIITPSRSFQFMLTPSAQRSALASMRRHLRPDGALVLDLFDPRLEWVVPKLDRNALSQRATIRNPATGLDVRIDIIERRPDPMRQLIDEVYRYTELDQSGREVRKATERLVLRWTLRSELRQLAELEGFTVEAEYGDFRAARPAYGGEQVWVLRPA